MRNTTEKLARLTIRQVRVPSMSFSTYAKFWTKLNDVYGIFKEKNLIHLEFVFAQYELNIIRFMVWNPVTWVPSFYLLYHESYISSKFRGETICPSLYRAANSLSSIFENVSYLFLGKMLTKCPKNVDQFYSEQVPLSPASSKLNWEVMRSIDPDGYRNIELEVWEESRKGNYIPLHRTLRKIFFTLGH